VIVSAGNLDIDACHVSPGNAYGTIVVGASTMDVDAALLARHTRVDKLPAVLDFAFAAAVRATVAGSRGTDVLARMFADDALYEGGATTAQQLPTFISNHDNGRFAYFVRAGCFKDVDVVLFTHVGNNLGVSWGPGGATGLVMPAFQTMLPPEEIWKLVAYLMSLSSVKDE